MAISKVTVYVRTTGVNGKRRYAQADHRKAYPDGTIFCLRYEVAGKRKWETLKGGGVRYALAIAKVRESELLTGAINKAKSAPVVPVSVEPKKPARLTVTEAIACYLRNASTKSPRTYQGLHVYPHAVPAILPEAAPGRDQSTRFVRLRHLPASAGTG